MESIDVRVVLKLVFAHGPLARGMGYSVPMPH